MATVDVVQEAFFTECARYRAQSFQHYLTKDVGAEPQGKPQTRQTKAKNNGASESRQIGHYSYLVGPFDETPELMPIRLKGKRVQIFFRGSWAEVATYMDSIEQQTNPLLQSDIPQELRQMRGWRMQSEWWSMNGIVFRLLDLPYELRCSVYSWLLKGDIEPYLPRQGRNAVRSTVQLISRQPSLCILGLNRQVYRETTRLLYRRITFLLRDDGVLGKTLENGFLSLQLRRVEIALSFEDFFSFFGLPVTDQQHLTPSRAAKLMRGLQLTQLTIRMAAPTRNSPVPGFNDACQRTMVSLALKAALPFVRGHPTFLAGYVKNVQARAFERFCWQKMKQFVLWKKTSSLSGVKRLSLRDYDEWMECMDGESDGGVALDSRESVQSEASDRTLSGVDEDIHITHMQCSCEARCSADDWDADS